MREKEDYTEVGFFGIDNDDDEGNDVVFYLWFFFIAGFLQRVKKSHNSNHL